MAADYPPIIRVKQREELVAALKLRTASIVIEDEGFARPFEQYAADAVLIDGRAHRRSSDYAFLARVQAD
jgi:hypothetical protein